MPFEGETEWKAEAAADIANQINAGVNALRFEVAPAETEYFRGLLRRPDILDHGDGLTGSHFQNAQFGAIVRKAAEMLGAHMTPTVEALEPAARAVGLSLDDLLAHLDLAPSLSPKQSAALATTIREASEKRAIYNAIASDFVGFMVDNQAEASTTWLAELEAKVRGLEVGGSGAGMATTDDAFASMIAGMQNPAGRIMTGVPDLDAGFAGFRRGALGLVEGRPGNYKTGFAIELMTNAARSGHVVHFLSMEMSREEVVERMVSAASFRAGRKITFEDIGKDPGRVWQEHGDFIGGLRDGLPKIHIDDSGGQSLSKLQTNVRATARKFGRKVDLVVVDHVGLMAQAMPGKAGIYEKTTITSQGLKAFAMATNCVVLGLAQSNREPAKRSGFRACRPRLEDLRDSGSLEQDANVIMGVHREHYYLERTTPDADDFQASTRHANDLELFESVLEVEMLKQRGGRAGRSTFLDCRVGYNVIGNLDQDRKDRIRRRTEVEAPSKIIKPKG